MQTENHQAIRTAGMTDARAQLVALNAATYAAARAAIKAGSPDADELRQMALRTDEMVDALTREVA